MISAIKKKILSVVKSMLTEGMNLRKIALCIALGFVLGIFPVLGATSLLCTAAALALRLNLPAIQIINYMVYPLQLVMLAPFESPFISKNLIDILQNDLWGSMVNLWDLTLYAMLTWLVISPLLILLLYSISKPLIRAVSARHGSNPI
jgi:hypothetical protein